MGDSLVAQGAGGFIALQIQVMELKLKIEWLTHVLGAHIKPDDPQSGYQMVEKDSRAYIEAHGERLTKLREHLETLEKVLKQNAAL